MGETGIAGELFRSIITSQQYSLDVPLYRFGRAISFADFGLNIRGSEHYKKPFKTASLGYIIFSGA